MSISAELEGFFQKLVERGVVKNTGDKTDFLSPDLINHNYRKLDKLYEKALTPSDLDERIFFKERANLFTPSKFTPFARQGYANRGPPKNLVGKLGGTTQEAFSSHRILNYEMLDKQETAQKPLGGNLNDMVGIG